MGKIIFGGLGKGPVPEPVSFILGANLRQSPGADARPPARRGKPPRGRRRRRRRGSP
jgi:hypothetical protein